MYLFFPFLSQWSFLTNIVCIFVFLVFVVAFVAMCVLYCPNTTVLVFVIFIAVFLICGQFDQQNIFHKTKTSIQIKIADTLQN